MKEISLIKTSKFLLLFSLMIMVFIGCDDDNDDDELGNWVEESSFDGETRYGAVTFTIGNKGYLIGGYDGDDYYDDTWEYNAEDNFWRQLAKFPGDARVSAVGFALNGKGYVGTGYNGEDDLNDFWEYDPSTDVWTQKNDFSTTVGMTGVSDVDTDADDYFKREGAIGFAVGGNGYIGTGNNGSQQKDFWKYDATTDTWEQVFGYGGDKRQNSSVFVINDVAYIGTGLENGLYPEDFYSFDGTTWTELTDLDDDDEDDTVVSLYDGVAFAIDGKGYIATGVSTSVSSEVWEYTPSTDTWTEVPNFEGVSRQGASAFSFDYDGNSRGYVLMGRTGGTYFNDIWEFKPDELENDED